MAHINKKNVKRAAHLVLNLGKTKSDAARIMGVHHYQITRYIEQYWFHFGE